MLEKTVWHRKVASRARLKPVPWWWQAVMIVGNTMEHLFDKSAQTGK